MFYFIQKSFENSYHTGKDQLIEEIVFSIQIYVGIVVKIAAEY